MRKMETIPSPFSLMSKWGQLRWLEGCRLWRGTWLVNWTGSWLVVASRAMGPCSTAQLVVFVRVVFDDFSTKEHHCPKDGYKGVPWNTCITTASVTAGDTSKSDRLWEHNESRREGDKQHSLKPKQPGIFKVTGGAVCWMWWPATTHRNRCLCMGRGCVVGCFGWNQEFMHKLGWGHLNAGGCWMDTWACIFNRCYCESKPFELWAGR